jgi:hypothetical protein
MGPSISIDLVQTLIYAGLTAAGYLLSHYGLLGRLVPNANGSKPAPTPANPSQPLPPALVSIAQIFEQQLMQILTNAVKALLQQQASGNSPAPAQPTQSANAPKQ